MEQARECWDGYTQWRNTAAPAPSATQHNKCWTVNESPLYTNGKTVVPSVGPCGCLSSLGLCHTEAQQVQAIPIQQAQYKHYFLKSCELWPHLDQEAVDWKLICFQAEHDVLWGSSTQRYCLLVWSGFKRWWLPLRCVGRVEACQRVGYPRQVLTRPDERLVSECQPEFGSGGCQATCSRAVLGFQRWQADMCWFLKAFRMMQLRSRAWRRQLDYSLKYWCFFSAPVSFPTKWKWTS